MSSLDRYQHFNSSPQDGVRVGIEEIAEQVEQLNYGMLRMVAALAKARLRRRPNDEFALALKDVLDKGALLMRPQTVTLPPDLAAIAGSDTVEIRPTDWGHGVFLNGERLRCFTPDQEAQILARPDVVAMLDRADDRNENERRGRVLASKNYSGTPRRTGYLRGLVHRQSRRSA